MPSAPEVKSAKPAMSVPATKARRRRRGRRPRARRAPGKAGADPAFPYIQVMALRAAGRSKVTRATAPSWQMNCASLMARKPRRANAACASARLSSAISSAVCWPSKGGA
jgi:hypothetical protein